MSLLHAMSLGNGPVSFLDLPREIRDQIYGEYFFPGEMEPDDHDQDHLGLAVTTVRQITPYDKNGMRGPVSGTAIIRTCRQMQNEAEAVLYGTSSWSLMYQDWDDNIKLSYEFFERFPKRLRRLIRRVERKCFSQDYNQTISLFDWTLFMTFLARECPNLRSLKLWAPGDIAEGPGWVNSCTKDQAWVQAILQIRNLVEFDMPVIKGGVVYDYPAFKHDFLPWIKSFLLQDSQSTAIPEAPYLQATSRQAQTPFRFLDLDISIRKSIYRLVLLPPNRRIHPQIKSWYDQTTQNAVSLFSTCKKVHEEASMILYGEGIFTSPMAKYDAKLLRLLRHEAIQPTESLHPKYLSQIKHVRLTARQPLKKPLLACVARRLKLKTLELVMDDEMLLERMNREWARVMIANPDPEPPATIASLPELMVRYRLVINDPLRLVEADQWRGGWGNHNLRDIARIPHVSLETPGAVRLHPSCEEWITNGLREQLVCRTNHSRNLDWLYEEDLAEDQYTRSEIEGAFKYMRSPQPR